MLYLDTSALAKLYIIEPDGQRVESLVMEHEGELFTSITTYAEMLSALARCLREKRISRQDFEDQRRAFLDDWSALHVVHLTAPVLAPAARLIEKHGLRGFDAIQLCAALWIGRPLFGCFDDRLRRAAAAQGLTAVP